MAFEEDVMKELRTINGNVNDTKVATARIEGKMELHDSRIERNKSDIEKADDARVAGDLQLHESIGTVQGKLNGLAVKVAGAAATVGAAAGAISSAISNAVKGGG